MEFETSIEEIESDGATGEMVETTVEGLEQLSMFSDKVAGEFDVEVRYISGEWFVPPDDIARWITNYDRTSENLTSVANSIHNDLERCIFGFDDSDGMLEVQVSIGERKPVTVGEIDE